jgi:hypothetical protein
MGIWINLRPNFDQLRDALSICHLVIIPQACYGFQFNDGNKLIIGEPLEFGSIANDHAGWLQIVQSLESVVRNLTAPSLPFCVSFQLLRQIGRHVGKDDRVVIVVA